MVSVKSSAAGDGEFREPRRGRATPLPEGEPLRTVEDEEKGFDEAGTGHALPLSLAARALRSLLWMLLGGGVLGLLWWLYPIIIIKLVMPILAAVQNTFTRVQIGFFIVLFLSVAPTFFLAGFASLWLAGIVFGYGLGMLLATVGTTIGMAVPFLLGRRSERLQRYVIKLAESQPNVAASLQAVSLAGEFRSIVLLRLGPVPYVLLNYGVSAVPSVKFWQHYLLASVLTRVPLNLAELQFGIVIKDIVEAYQGSPPSTLQAIEIAVSTIAAVVTVVGGYLYSKRAWRQIMEELALHELEASEASNTSLENQDEDGVVMASLLMHPNGDTTGSTEGSSGSSSSTPKVLREWMEKVAGKLTVHSGWDKLSEDQEAQKTVAVTFPSVRDHLRDVRHAPAPIPNKQCKHKPLPVGTGLMMGAGATPTDPASALSVAPSITSTYGASPTAEEAAAATEWLASHQASCYSTYPSVSASHPALPLRLAPRGGVGGNSDVY